MPNFENNVKIKFLIERIAFKEKSLNVFLSNPIIYFFSTYINILYKMINTNECTLFMVILGTYFVCLVLNFYVFVPTSF